MMRFRTVSPECIPLSIGRKPAPRSCKEEDALGFSTERIPAPLKPDPPVSEAQTGSPASAKSNGDVLLQWGRRKRARLSRAEGRAVSAEDDDDLNDDDEPARPVRARRRSTKPRAAIAVTAPCGSYYSRGANLQPSTPGCDSAATAAAGSYPRVSENHLGSPSRPEKRSLFPPEKPAKAAAGDSSMQPEPNRERMGDGTTTKAILDRFEWPRIYVSLSRKEKEDDFLVMKGTKLPQRPKKRAKNIERALQYCFPGMWLSDLTRGRYEVRERKCVKKKQRGLKGMENLDGDSE